MQDQASALAPVFSSRLSSKKMVGPSLLPRGGVIRLRRRPWVISGVSRIPSVWPAYDAREIYAVVKGLSRLDYICLCITLRISTIPPTARLDTPTLSIEAARDAFYRACRNSERSNLVDNILERSDFHLLPVSWDISIGTRYGSPSKAY